jgi:adenosylhomocysteine nucleosidase
LAESTRVAIVAALEREVWPLVKNCRRIRKKSDGHEFEFFETARTIVVCGGIGAEWARRATEAVIQLYDPAIVISAGFAGALQAGLSVGQVLTPRTVVDVSDGSRIDTGRGTGVLVTFGSVADAAQKAKLARAFAAQVVDMEAAGVAKGAEAHGVRFMACKAISDASDVSMPALTEFVGADGKFQTGKFAVHVALRPWLWKSMVKIARDSGLASRKLCQSLAAFADLGSGEPVPIQATVSLKP